MNRHGISQNPTTEERALLRRLWAADDAHNRANRLRREVLALQAENARLRDALSSAQPTPAEGGPS